MPNHATKTLSWRRMPRALAFAAAALAVVAVGIACGDDDDTEDTTASATATSTATSGAETPASSAFPVTIEHKYGSTTIDEAPQRVVALGYQEHDFIYALGVQPVAARYWYGDEEDVVYPWAEDAAAGHQPVIMNMLELDVEEVASFDPDLILGTYSGITEEEYALLSEIAPTIAQSGDYVDYGQPWQETARMIGAALGKGAEAEGLIEDVEGAFVALAAEHPEWEGLEVAVVAGAGDEIGFFASEDPRARIFTSLGFVVPAAFDDIAAGQFYGTLSIEQAQMLDVDLIVWTQLEFLDGGRATIEADPCSRSSRR